MTPDIVAVAARNTPVALARSVRIMTKSGQRIGLFYPKALPTEGWVKINLSLLGDRLTVRLQPLELRIGVRIPASQPLPLPGSPLKPAPPIEIAPAEGVYINRQYS